jgi:tetratricopeptide (TPR) repeat protein
VEAQTTVREALETERKTEQEFAEHARESESSPRGWPAALVMFHISMWRERMRNSLAEVAEGRPAIPAPPAEKQDEINDADLAGAIGIPLSDAAARCDHLLTELMDLYDRVGEKPFEWYAAKSTTAAVLRSSLIHPSIHMFEYYRENGQHERASEVVDRAAAVLRAAQAPAYILGTGLYNSAIARVAEGRNDAALELLCEAMELRADLKAAAPADSDLAGLRGDPRFQELVKT